MTWARQLREVKAEIERLRDREAVLREERDTARREALEEAAKVCKDKAEHLDRESAQLRPTHPLHDLYTTQSVTAWDLADAIRALIDGGENE